MIYQRLTDLIGHTPILQLNRYSKNRSIPARLMAKLECFNPLSSAKDRVGCAMIDDAEQRGLLKPGGTVIEPTSGNTGIALAMLAAARGYRAVIVIPDSMSVERRQLMRAYGAEVILTPGDKGMQGAVDYAYDLAAKTPGAFVAGQFDNPANPQAHQKSTAEEIWAWASLGSWLSQWTNQITSEAACPAAKFIWLARPLGACSTRNRSPIWVRVSSQLPPSAKRISQSPGRFSS